SASPARVRPAQAAEQATPARNARRSIRPPPGGPAALPPEVVLRDRITLLPLFPHTAILPPQAGDHKRSNSPDAPAGATSPRWHDVPNCPPAFSNRPPSRNSRKSSLLFLADRLQPPSLPWNSEERKNRRGGDR